jgi:hypothetical protein
MPLVRLIHPEVEQEIVVDTSAEPMHANSGWRRAPGQDHIPREELPAEVQRFEGQEQIRMRHPNVHDEITVGLSAMGMHQEKGWVRVEEAAAQELEDKTLEELRDEVRARGLKVSGSKDELIERLQTETTQEPAAPADKEDEG